MKMLIYSNPKSFMRKIGLRLRSASVYRWLSEVEASHNSFRIAMSELDTESDIKEKN